ncbi:MAG: hypothetical protein AAB477_00240 [Patescibacteria group bacterium]
MIRKLIPSILIVLIAVNLFAPFTLGIDKKNNIEIKKSVAEADLSITLVKMKRTKTSISFGFDITQLSKTDNFGIIAVVTNKKGTTMSKESLEFINFQVGLGAGKDCGAINDTLFTIPKDSRVAGGRDGCGSNWLKDNRNEGLATVTVPNLVKNTPYYISFFGYAGDKDIEKSLAFPIYDREIRTTSDNEEDDTIMEELGTTNSDSGYLPWCTRAVFKVNIGGCFAQILYTITFKPTSFIFGLAGQFFDFTFFYSISDSSYRSGFVVEGWGVVRDFVNMFFIFVLLYIAFSTILSLHGFKTKEMIINVVIIGLLINFSLFATQVIIDTSNILARVFYNSVTSGSVDESTKEFKEERGAQGEIQLSAQIVNMVDPQKLIIKASRVGSTDRGTTDNSNQFSRGISVGTFILVTLLASAVNVVGIIVFLSVGLIFLARVIGLWFAMIFVPFAFFSYTVPAMQDIEMIGWKKWWPETLKLAFLAPIFMFFMYLIIKFLGGKEFLKLNGDSGAAFIIAIIVPFIFIMILLLRAKGIAKDLSGKIGAAITKGAVVAGGLAVAGGGLAAAGGAALGRGLITNPMKMMQSSQATRTAALKNFSMVKPATWGKAMSARMANFSVKGGGKGVGTGVYDVATRREIKREGSNKLRDRLLGIKDRKADKGHASQLLDEQADKIQKGAKYSDLSAPEQAKAKTTINNNEVSKALFGKESDKLDNSQISMLSGIVNTNGAINTAALSTAATTLGKDISKFYDPTNADPTKRAVKDANHHEKIYNKPDKDHVGNALAFAAGGTYDIRNMKSGGLTALGIASAFLGIAPVFALAMSAHTSGALRTGLKKFTGVDHGFSQKDFLKDLSHTLDTALSSIKISVKTDGKGHSDAKAKVGGGGH